MCNHRLIAGGHANVRELDCVAMNHKFQTTHWSVIVAAGQGSPSQAKSALTSLCEIYWFPLYAYALRQVQNTHEAQDLTQSFFAELLDKNYVGKATPDRGKFRAFLLTAFKNFLSKQWEKQKALKRGGGRVAISLDFEFADSRLSIEPADGLTPEQCYDQQWTIALLEQILQQLQIEFERSGKAEQFAELKAFIIGDHSGITYAQVSEKLGMTEAAAKKSASRMRQRYRELLRDAIAQTVNGPGEIDDEIRSLFATLEA